MIHYYLKACHDLIKSGINGSEELVKDDVAQALGYYYRILVAEYNQDFEQEGMVSKDPISCDFCGDEIFQTIFECSAVSDTRNDCSRRLCALCVAEGRNCACGSLRIRTIHKFTDLLDLRNSVAEWCGLRENEPEYKPKPIKPS